MLYKIFTPPADTQSPAKYHSHASAATVAEIQALLAQTPGYAYAQVCGYDETRAYYADQRLSEFQRMTGRIQAVTSEPRIKVRDIKTRIDRAIGETDALIALIQAKESADIVSMLEAHASGVTVTAHSAF